MIFALSVPAKLIDLPVPSSSFLKESKKVCISLTILLLLVTLPILEISTMISPVLSAVAFKFPSITISLST